MRRHFVFLRRCGCPEGVTDYRDGCVNADQAWRAMYGNATGQRIATERGVRCVFVDHETYSREFYPLMATPCPHTAESSTP